MSYKKDLILSTLSICCEKFGIWPVQVLLHCFDVVKMYCPDRVIHQFGLS